MTIFAWRCQMRHGGQTVSPTFDRAKEAGAWLRVHPDLEPLTLVTIDPDGGREPTMRELIDTFDKRFPMEAP